MVKLIALAGSLRKDSFNKKLIRIAVELAKAHGAHVTLIDLKDYPLPIYDGDIEETSGIPESGKKLKQLFIDHQGFLFSCPEYNSSLTGVFKNTIDWISRPLTKGEVPYLGFAGKTCALMSASPGALGGMRGLVAARSLLGNMGVFLHPDQVTVPKAHEAFTHDGKLKDTPTHTKLEKLCHSVVDMTEALSKDQQ